MPADLVATDSEWDDAVDGKWLSTAFTSATGTVVFVRSDQVTKRLMGRLDAEAERLGAVVRYVGLGDLSHLLALARPHLFPDGRGPGRLRLAFFFSPKDVEYALGWHWFKAAIDAGQIRQRHSLRGRVPVPAPGGKGSCSVELHDLSGWAGKMSLKKFAEGLGIEMADKNSLDRYKSRMRVALKREPALFLRYAVEDARTLLKVHSAFVGFVRGIMGGVLGLPPELVWEERLMPRTQGRLVAGAFERWLFAWFGRHTDAVRFCTRKLGLLDPDDDRYRASRAARHELLSACRTPEALAESRTDSYLKAIHKTHDKARYLSTALDAAGVKSWAARAVTDSAVTNALVHGGRCVNERPDEYRVGPGADIDVSGCYGTSLRGLSFPVGVPTCWSYGPNDKRPTLKDWLRDNESGLVPHLWTVTVSTLSRSKDRETGGLSFAQDLFYSKLVKATHIRKALDGDDIPADFVPTRCELTNAVITTDTLGVIRKVATEAERKELMRAEVQTAVAYRLNDRVDGPAEWVRRVLEAPIPEVRPRTRPGARPDDRCRWWFGVPLEEFVGRLADERKRVKGDGPPGLEQVLKLMVNTLYGDFASPYFVVSNTVLANVITARGRVGVWMVAKALGLRQSITDGGIYDPCSVPRFNPDRRKPGLATLGRMWVWKDHKSGRTFVPLPGLVWEPGTPLPADADALALDHVRRFWAPYGLDFPFELAHEHKLTFIAAAFWNKSDYALTTLDGKTVYKLRGKTYGKQDGNGWPHPLYRLLANILAGSDEFPREMRWRRRDILKIGRWKLAQGSETGFAHLKGLRPGDTIPPESQEFTARFNSTGMPVDDQAAFLKRKKRKKIHRGKPVRWFERFAPGGIAAMHRAIYQDSLDGRNRRDTLPMHPRTHRG